MIVKYARVSKADDQTPALRLRAIEEFGDGEMRQLQGSVTLLAAQFLFRATLAYKECTFVM